MEKTTKEIRQAKQLAKDSLTVMALSYKSLEEEPYIWACGMPMRIYNDNRLLLGNFDHRYRVTSCFVTMMRKYQSEFNFVPDFIIGTSTSGIAPAAAVAKRMGKDLLVRKNGQYRCYPHDLSLSGIEQSLLRDCNADIIISTISAIPSGVELANNQGIGFGYVRAQVKDHGKKLQTEGVIKPLMNYILLTSDESLEEIEDIKQMLKTLGIKFCRSLNVRDKYYIMTQEELAGKSAVVIEDLFSTGGSAVKEVRDARLDGMTVPLCASIFSYGFKCLEKQFFGKVNISGTDEKLSKPCVIDSILEFPTLMEVVEELNFYDSKTIAAMKDENSNFDERYEKFLSEKNG